MKFGFIARHRGIWTSHLLVDPGDGVAELNAARSQDAVRAMARYPAKKVYGSGRG